MNELRDTKISNRFLENRLRTAIFERFGDLEPAALQAVASLFDWVEVPGGRHLFRQGDDGDSMYVLASGRLQVLLRRTSGVVETLDHITPGETVGEMALITGEPRTADIVAMRDSVLARLSKANFEVLAEQYPRVLMHISRNIIERLQNRNKTKQAPKRIINICLLPITGGANAQATARQICSSLTAHGSVLLLDSDYVNQALRRPNIANAVRDERAGYHDLASWIEEQESSHRFVVYLPDPGDTEWTRRCLRQADEILLLADAHAPPDLHLFERQYLRGDKRITSAGQRLVLLHPPGEASPKGTRAWLAKRDLLFYHHLKTDGKQGFDRLARFLSGNAIGLVFSGGAAKGFAHIGVYRALQEAGIVVDIIGGTSIGAVMGAMAAQGWSGEEMRSHCRRVFRTNPTSDFNWIPWISIFKGKKLNRLLRENFGDQQIEDCWLNFFCVSCNLTKIHPHVHRSGGLLDAIRASISIPGVFPPHEFQNDLHVDGGVFNNLPVDVMSQSGVGTMIAVDLQTYRAHDGSEHWGGSGKRRLPNLLFVVMESTMLSGRRRTMDNKKEVDLYFNPPLRGFSLIDWGKFEIIENIGYIHAKEVLATSTTKPHPAA